MVAYHNDKPASIAAIQIICWIKVGLLGLGLCGILALASQVGGGGDPAVAGMVTLLLVFFAGYAIAYAVVAVNITKGRNWARIMVIVIEALNLALAPFTIGGLDGPTAFGSVVGVILSVVVIACASQRTARDYCLEMSR